MALLKREEWQGFVRDVDWSYSYVDDEAIYPEWHSGTGKVPRQAWLAWGLVTPAGRHYCEPHLFIFHVGADLLIDGITAYWNDAGISQQLGHNEVD